MKRVLTIFGAWAFGIIASASAQIADTLAVRAGMVTYIVPGVWVESVGEGSQTTVTLKGGKEKIEGEIVPTPHVDDTYPTFRTFKFNDKYNDALFADAEGVVTADAVDVYVTSCIGRTLCPSFSLTSDDCNVYIGEQRQLSHGNRMRFDQPVVYTIARPGHRLVVAEQKGDTYNYTYRPWGREVTVRVDFAVSHASDVPRMDITLDGGKQVSSINKDNYLAATIVIDGGGVFPDMETTAVSIRGRGNSSWEQYDKKPYRLKFGAKQKPFGLKGGKSWCLLAQARTGTLLTNPIALRVATMIGTEGANHVVPVELYINKEYRGSYIFTENPGFANNSIDLTDETKAYMLEADEYFDDQWLMYDDTYDLTVNLKEPKFEDIAETFREFREAVVEHFNRYTSAIRGKKSVEYEAMMDIDSWARFMLINDLTYNTEIGIPRSVKMYRKDWTDATDRYVWGPVWDFDWTFGLPETIFEEHAEDDFYKQIGFNYGWSASGFNPGTIFYDMLQNSDNLKAARYRVWMAFVERLDELLDYIDDYQAYARKSFVHDNTLWQKEVVDNSAKAKAWLKKRAAWLTKTMPKYPLPEPVYAQGDVNEDGRISTADLVCVANHILHFPNDFFNPSLADLNGDGQITVADLQLLVRRIVDAKAEAE